MKKNIESTATNDNRISAAEEIVVSPAGSSSIVSFALWKLSVLWLLQLLYTDICPSDFRFTGKTSPLEPRTMNRLRRLAALELFTSLGGLCDLTERPFGLVRTSLSGSMSDVSFEKTERNRLINISEYRTRENKN